VSGDNVNLLAYMTPLYNLPRSAGRRCWNVFF